MPLALRTKTSLAPSTTILWFLAPRTDRLPTFVGKVASFCLPAEEPSVLRTLREDVGCGSMLRFLPTPLGGDQVRGIN